MASFIDRDGCNDRNFVLRSTTRLATTVFSAEVGIINLYLAPQYKGIFLLTHRLHNLVVNEPCRAVVNPKVAHQRKRGNASLCLPH